MNLWPEMETIPIERVVGRRIARLLTSVPKWEDGEMTSAGYVELEDGLIFGLKMDGIYRAENVSRLRLHEPGWPRVPTYIDAILTNASGFPEAVVMTSTGEFFTNNATADRTYEPMLDDVNEAWVDLLAPRDW